MQLENLDAVQILSFGAIGLGFLLAFLTFILISLEQHKPQPRPSILDQLRWFMAFTVVLLLIGAVASYMNQARDFERINEELSVQIAHYDKLENELGKTVTRLNTANQASTVTNEKYMNQAKNLERLKEELSKERARYDKSENKLEETVTQLNATNSELAATKGNVINLRSALDTQKEEMNDLDNGKSQLASSRANVETLRRRVIKLDGELTRISDQEVTRVFRSVCKAKYFDCPTNRAANSQTAPWRDMTPYEANICSLACE